LHSSNKIDSDLYDPTRVNDKNYQVNVSLPADGTWYNYFSKEIEEGVGFKKELALKEMLVYIRGGSIIPIKLHNNRLSLVRAFFMPIKLEVYPDILGKATGHLFFDDGVSFQYKSDNKYLLFHYTFGKNLLSFTISPSNRTFVEESYYVTISDIAFYNQRKCPREILARNHKHSVFECKSNTLSIYDLKIPLDG
jgi:alpha-glucosidase (family GH31 glycosyl hydrolase)